jgi:radical SAM protein with 4Fe4S-binding SPASM domain
VLDSPLKRFILSLDGFQKPTFEKIRFRAKYDLVYPAVQELLRLRAERGQTYPVVIAQFSVMRDNAEEAEAFRAFWSERGAEVKIRPMLEWTATGSVRSATIVHDAPFRIACPWANNTMAIHQDGTVVACAVDYEGRFDVGNVRELSVKEAWSRLGTQLREIHRAHKWNELPSLCAGCGDWQTAGALYDDPQAPLTRPFWYEK